MLGDKTRFYLSDFVTILCIIVISQLYPEYSDLNKNLQNEANLLNNTHEANATFLIFNRVPKAGTETLMGLLDLLSYRNNFTASVDNKELKDKRGENTYITKAEIKNYVKLFDGHENVKMNFPLSYTKHVNFFNFEEHNRKNPIYVNMVRHPIERVISWYYYIRQGWYQFRNDDKRNTTKLKRENMNPTFFKVTYEECFNKELPECRYPIGEPSHAAWYGGSHKSQVKNSLVSKQDLKP